MTAHHFAGLKTQSAQSVAFRQNEDTRGVHGKQDHGQIGDYAEQGFAGAQGLFSALALGHVPQQQLHGWLAMMQQRDSHYFRFYFAPVEPLERSLCRLLAA